ncbi:MAG: hypothetical protein ACYC0H_15795 [Solirubrobacteraceae bacterium]
MYRSSGTTRSAAALTVFLGAIVVAAVVPGKLQVGAWVFLPFWLIGTWRTWNLGVHIEADGAKVVGVLLTRRVPWHEIEGFDIRPLGGYPYIGHLVRRDGSPALPILALASPGRPKWRMEHFRRQVQRPVDELNRIVDQHRGMSTSA